jgi:hypothetical protein
MPFPQKPAPHVPLPPAAVGDAGTGGFHQPATGAATGEATGTTGTLGVATGELP